MFATGYEYNELPAISQLQAAVRIVAPESLAAGGRVRLPPPEGAALGANDQQIKADDQ